jgi:hypothetical protein
VGLHSDTDLYRAVTDLARFVAGAVASLRRDVKPTLGRMLLDECVWMAVVVRRANIARDAAKLPLLEELLEQLEIVQFTLRIARDCAFLSNNAFATSLPLTASVGRQATALKNHYVSAPSPVA